jgi:putative two-component system hydrogenase maturation factor HypX/HoxX
VSVELAPHGESLRAAVRRYEPELIVAPMLKTAVPREVWTAHTCLIVHPGPLGDRGPSSLEWAIHENASEWGVTVLQADAEMDAGNVWATVACPVPPVGKSDLYRNEVSDAAMAAVLLAVDRFACGTFTPRAQDSGADAADVQVRPYVDQRLRRIHWDSDSAETVLRKLRAADSQPGVLDELLGADWYLHGGHPEDSLRGRPGELVATRAGAVCRATTDGAVWIPELRPRRRPGGPATFKLPAATALADRLPALPENPAPAQPDGRRRTWSDIRYQEDGQAGFLSFSFPGGAMSTAQCRRLLDAYRTACSRPTSLLVLGGTRDFFSNGIHLNVIEAAQSPAEESWHNLHAIDDVVREIVETDSQLVIAALSGDAAAGGVPLALAADHVVAREDVVLNPYYQHMGGLYGSEYWTYLLPRRVGPETAAELTQTFEPVGTRRAVEIGLLDAAFGETVASFRAQLRGLGERLARHPDLGHWLDEKRGQRARDEQMKPLETYRAEELARCHECFFGIDQSYHEARRRFVHKQGLPCAVAPPARRDAGLDLVNSGEAVA